MGPPSWFLFFSVASAVDWTIVQNQNDVYGGHVDNVTIVDGGHTDTWQECQAVAANHSIIAFTWHDKNQGSFANVCWLRKDGVWSLTAEDGHVSGYYGTPPSPPGQTFDCPMRKLAYEHGMKLLPRMKGFSSLYYALNLNDPTCLVPPPEDVKIVPTSTVAVPPSALFVSPVGSDGATGSQEDPLQSIQLACDRAGKGGTVVLREGTHFLTETIYLTPAHSGLTLMGYPGEDVAVSGGKLLKVNWKPYKVSDKMNIYVADITGQVTSVPGLQIDGARATRARYPNLLGGIEVSCGYGCLIPGEKAFWTPPNFTRFGNVTWYTDSNPAHDRNDTANSWFQHYMIGTNGLCSVYDPPVSYWCSQNTSGGGAFPFRTPSGVRPMDGILPNSPYADTSAMIINVWRPARWANWMFEVGKYDPKTNNFTFGYGGFQGARGENTGGDFFVENVMEELDNPGEYFFDAKTSQLYLFYNGTGAPPSTASVVTPQLQVLVNMTGTQWNPVKNITLTGVTYTATRYTYMEPHAVPSAGDWALERFAAVYLMGTEKAVIDSCAFDRLDGNGVMLSGYNRYTTITNSDFSFIGGNAMASWGFTNETATDRARPGIKLANYPMAGVDGTDGEHPRYNQILGNTAREVGLYEKQSSFYVQAKTAQSTLQGNVFFNGPRAGINANDGFGGGDVLSYNLVFSTCRESGDHGPFNSWDRQPFLTTVRDGTPSMTPAVRELHHNFFIDNYSPQENVDNDDGSAYYNTHHNFFVWGGNGMKNDFGGHDNSHHNNIYAYADQALGLYDAPMLDGHEDSFFNNTVVLTGADFGSPICSGEGKTIIHDNTYYTQTGGITECGKQLKDWQALGNDQGSTVTTLPSDDTLISWARALLDS